MPGMAPDPVTRALITTMESADVTVDVIDRNGAVTVTARIPDNHVHVVTGDDVYRTVCLAAERRGIELRNG